MWEEFPEGGCWIIRIKRKVAQNYVNRMWENLLIACIGEAFEMPDVVGCVLSTRLKDDVLSVWNLSNRNTEARFRIGEKLKEVLDLDMNALIQYKDHMQSLQDYSTFRNAKNYMFAPSPNQTPLMGALATPLQQPGDPEDDFEEMLPAAAIDTMLPPAAVDTEGFFSDVPQMKSPPLSADAPPFSPPTVLLTDTAMIGSLVSGQSPKLSPLASPWYPPGTIAASEAAPKVTSETNSVPTGSEETSKKSWAAIAAAAPKSGSTSPKGKGFKS